MWKSDSIPSDIAVLGIPDCSGGPRDVTSSELRNTYLQLQEGDRILLVDDVVSTGGTLLPILKCLDSIGAIVSACWIVFEKDDGMNYVRSKGDWPLNSLVKITMDGNRISIVD